MVYEVYGFRSSNSQIQKGTFVSIKSSTVLNTSWLFGIAYDIMLRFQEPLKFIIGDYAQVPEPSPRSLLYDMFTSFIGSGLISSIFITIS